MNTPIAQRPCATPHNRVTAIVLAVASLTIVGCADRGQTQTTVDPNEIIAQTISGPVTGDGTFPSRGSIAPDAADPEPIASTGANKWDLITAADPTTFDRLEELGLGNAEFLPEDKQGGFVETEGAYLYRALFTDGTTVGIQIHPDIGSQAEANAAATTLLVPLGQLPALLRADIGHVSVIVGDNTGAGSWGEGITLQTGNIAKRLSDNRLEETLFHESVHTSLDRNYAYQTSQGWLDAQAADGRWLTEYGREDPDGEDLAETLLYAYALTYHPERFPDGMADEIRQRVPNRLAFISANIFPPGEQSGTEPRTVPDGS